MPPPYWRFHEQYGGQLGVGRLGDLPTACLHVGLERPGGPVR